MPPSSPSASVSSRAAPGKGLHTALGISLNELVLPFERLRKGDVEIVGGKNSSLGEMISSLADAGVRVPGGFATTAQAYRDFLKQNGLDERIRKTLADLDVEDVEKLTATGKQIREWVLATPLPARARSRGARRVRSASSGGKEISVAVRSSATAEDLPEASFAGQQETFLNVRGEAAVLKRDARGVRVAVQRPSDRLSRASGLRSQRRRACRPACSTWFAAISARAA